MIKLNELLRKMKLVEYSADEIYDGDNPYLEPNPEYEGDTEKSASSGEGGDSGSEAAEQAHKLNLVSKGWGRWADQSGKIVAKTVQGKLVKIDEPSVDDYAETGGTADDYIKHHPELAKKHGNTSSSTEPETNLPGESDDERMARLGNSDFESRRQQAMKTNPEFFNKQPEENPDMSLTGNTVNMVSGYAGKEQQVAKLAKQHGGAMNALQKISAGQRKAFAQYAQGAAESELGDAELANPELAKQSKMVGIMTSHDFDALGLDYNYSELEGFGMEQQANALYADAAWAASNDLAQGIVPEQNPETVKKFETFASQLANDMAAYVADSGSSEEEIEKRYGPYRSRGVRKSDFM